MSPHHGRATRAVVRGESQSERGAPISGRRWTAFIAALRGSNTGWTALVVLLSLAALRAPVLFDDRRLLAPIMDDAFYDLQIARNVSRGLGPTFDGIHPTNGFHPLWVVVLLPIVAAVDGDIAVLRVVSVLELGLAAGAAALLYRTLLSRIGHWPALAGALLLVASPGADTTLRTGLEGSLVALLAIVAWRLVPLAAEVANTARLAWLGVCCGLLALARLEAAILAPLVILLSRLRGRNLLAVAAPWAALVATHVSYNLIEFGTLAPVSALVKAYWNEGRPLPARAFLALTTQWPLEQLVARVARPDRAPALFVTMYLGSLAALGALAWVHRIGIVSGVRNAGALPMAFLALGTVLIDTVAIGSSVLWQAAPLLVGTAIVGAAACAAHPRVARVLAIALAGVAIWKGGRAFQAQPFSPTHESYAWLYAQVDEEDRIGSWNAGAIGWFSHRTVVNLDGLVNAPSFLEVLRRGHLDDYLTGERIDVLADVVIDGEPPPHHPLFDFLSTTELRYARVFEAPVREGRFVVYRRIP